jgi:hypothetical protein
MRLFAAIPGAALATAVIVSAALAVRQIAQPLNPRYDADPSLGALIPIVKERAAGRPVFVISPNMASGFPLTNYTGTSWPSRLSNMWPAVVAYDSATEARSPVQFHELDGMDPIERLGLETSVHDFIHSRPVLVLSLISVDQPGWGMQRLDLLRWLQRDPEFRAAWLAYDSVARVGNYVVWVRHDDPASTLPVPAVQSSPDGSARAPAVVHASPTAMVTAVVFLFTLFFVYRAGSKARAAW